MVTMPPDWAPGLENLVVLHDSRLIDAFRKTFERLWTALEGRPTAS